MLYTIKAPLDTENDFSSHDIIHRKNKVTVEIRIDKDSKSVDIAIIPEMDALALRQANTYITVSVGNSKIRKKCRQVLEHIYNHGDATMPTITLQYLDSYIHTNRHDKQFLVIGVDIGRLDYSLNTEHMLHAIYYATNGNFVENQEKTIVKLTNRVKQLEERNKGLFNLEKLEELDDQVLEDIMDQIRTIQKERKQCVICKIKSPIYACVPCGHRCMCSGCSILYDQSKDCPVCRAVIDDIMKIY